MGSSIESFSCKDKRTGRDAVPNPLRRAPKLLLTQLTDFRNGGRRGAELRRDAGWYSGAGVGRARCVRASIDSDVGSFRTLRPR